MKNTSLNQTFLYKEIFEQPAVLKRLISQEVNEINILVQAIREKAITQVVIAARGTSDNAARYAKYLFGAVNHLQVALATPSLYSIYRRPPRLYNSLVLGISQSGKSPDIVKVIEGAKQQGMLTATITNYPQSDLAQMGEYKINLHAGEERSIAATKTYTSELAAIALLSATLADDQSMLNVLEKAPSFANAMLELAPLAKDIAQQYQEMRYCIVIGRGFNYATAFELALKLKELTYTMVEPYSSADFLHGPLAVVEPGFPVIVFAPSGAMIEEMKALLDTLKQRHASIIAISDDTEILKAAHIPFQLPFSVPEWFSPITSIIPGQLFAMHLAYWRGLDIDNPRAIKKITETT